MFGMRNSFLLCGAILCGLVQLVSPFQYGVVCGGSMSPTLQSGQPFLVDRSAYRQQPVSRDDIVVFERNGTSYVKRVAAVEGETFFVLRYLDTNWDYPLQSEELPRVRRMLKHSPNSTAKLVRRRVPPGYCYVLGDAPHCSEDSRYFGPLPLDALRGKLVMAPTTAPPFAGVASASAPVRM